MTNEFRVQSLVMEGFKGFTLQQEINLKGRHLFLLGQNGNGKSSIIEAIRWGLIGSTGRPNEPVRNRSYTDTCRVIITIMKDGKQWRLQRTLLRGTSGGSESKLLDEQGQEHPMRAVIPQLYSANAGEGTHIICRSQSPRLSRQPEDLEPFERTVFDHLGLTNPRSLLSQIDVFLTEQELIEQHLGNEFTGHRDEIDKQIKYTEDQRKLILGSPPWGSKHPPSLTESETKAKKLISNITKNSKNQSLAGKSLDSLIDHAKDIIKSRIGQSELEKKLEEFTNFRKLLELFLDLQSQSETQQDNIKTTQCQLHTTLEGVSIDELRKCIKEKQIEADAATLKRQIIENTTSLLHLSELKSVLCPVCETEHPRSDFESRLQRMSNQLEDNFNSAITPLNSRLSRAEELEESLQLAESKLAGIRQKEIIIQKGIEATDVDGLTLSANESIEAILNRCKACEAEIDTQINNHEDWVKAMEARLLNLERESNFHVLQKKLHQLQESRNRFGEVEKAFKELVTFGESVRTIQRTVGTCLTERLEEELPGVAENISQVFAALTLHPWYDRLDFVKDKLPKLELQVTSSHDAGVRDPIGVLNGQAESALELVPYFTFSQIEEAPTKIYQVLLDDPTRAFDEEHISILVECLAKLGHYVQLIVASQETALFRTLLPQHFESGSYAIVEPAKWSYSEGPELNIEYG